MCSSAESGLCVILCINNESHNETIVLNHNVIPCNCYTYVSYIFDYLFFYIFSQAVTTALAQVGREKIYQWINELSSPETRENALLELSKKRESVPDLAPMLWHSCGTIAALLQVRGRASLISLTL